MVCRRIGICILLALCAVPAQAQTRLKDICRVKGQEENTLHGLGLVVGLKGTGDGANFLPTLRGLAEALQQMGNPLGEGKIAELKDAKNVALVLVTATVGPAGNLQGDKIDCSVSAIAAKSLAGGRLFLTPLVGPQAGSDRVYAFAEGPITLDDPKIPTTGTIHRGCRLEEDFRNVFVKNHTITLVLNEDHADFGVAHEVAELINSTYQGIASQPRRLVQRPGVRQAAAEWSGEGEGDIARAINQLYIEVQLPQPYRTRPTEFVAEIMGLVLITPPQTEARVVIRERQGSIVIGGDVEIGPVLVTHKNVVIDTTGGAGPGSDTWFAIDPGQRGASKLSALVAALNAVKVPPADIIDIIKALERNGKLHGHLIIE